MLMGGVTGGEIRGNVLTPGQRSQACNPNAGVDKQVRDDLRPRP